MHEGRPSTWLGHGPELLPPCSTSEDYLWSRTGVLWVILLLLLASGIQAIVITRSVVPALDSVRFVRFAQQIDAEGVLPALRGQWEQPLFGLWVWLVHLAWVTFASRSASAWATSVQLAAAVPLVLATAPLLLAMRRLVGLRAALAGAILFCFLPEIARLGADGISDSTHLLWFLVAVWAVVEYLVRRPEGTGAAEIPAAGKALGWLLLAGVAMGLALLSRAEVLVLLVAVAISLVRVSFRPAQLIMAGSCWLWGLAIVWVPYLVVVDATTPPMVASRMLGRQPPLAAGDEPAVTWSMGDAQPPSFAEKESSISLRRRGYPIAIPRFVAKLADAFGYWVGALALWGIWCRRKRRSRAADRLLQWYFILFCIVCLRFSAVEGYLVPRHLVTLVASGIAMAGLGALELGDRLAAWADRSGWLVRRRAPVAWSIVLAAVLASLPQTLVRHHISRLGHRTAGQWLASPVAAPGEVVDTRGWTGLYSGRTTHAFSQAPAVLGKDELAYLVVEAQELQYESPRGRTLRWLAQLAATPAAQFPSPFVRGANQQPVVILRWHPPRFRRWLASHQSNPSSSPRTTDRKADLHQRTFRAVRR